MRMPSAIPPMRAAVGDQAVDEGRARAIGARLSDILGIGGAGSPARRAADRALHRVQCAGSSAPPGPAPAPALAALRLPGEIGHQRRQVRAVSAPGAALTALRDVVTRHPVFSIRRCSSMRKSANRERSGTLLRCGNELGQWLFYIGRNRAVGRGIPARGLDPGPRSCSPVFPARSPGRRDGSSRRARRCPGSTITSDRGAALDPVGIARRRRPPAPRPISMGVGVTDDHGTAAGELPRRSGSRRPAAGFCRRAAPATAPASMVSVPFGSSDPAIQRLRAVTGLAGGQEPGAAATVCDRVAAGARACRRRSACGVPAGGRDLRRLDLGAPCRRATARFRRPLPSLSISADDALDQRDQLGIGLAPGGAS